MKLELRKARVEDVPEMQRLVNAYARQGLMLPRSLHSLYEHIRDYHVARIEQRLVGCVSLHVSWADLAEIRTLAVDAAVKGQGIGRSLAEAALREASELGLRRVFVLTYVPGFFEKLGFQPTDKASLPQKIWQECVHCPHFPDCDETAMSLDLGAID